MNGFLNFLQELFTMKNNDEIKVGLTQFKQPTIEPVKKEEVSIRTKDVKLSDLMRRAG